MKDIIINEFLLIFSFPLMLMALPMFVVGYLATKAFAGADGKLNESKEGWDLISGFIAMMGLALFFGSILISIFYELTLPEYVFWITLASISGIVGKATSKSIDSIFLFITNKFNNGKKE